MKTWPFPRGAGRPTPGRGCPPSGFTVIELLVVAAVIAILAALLIPSLARANARAKSTVCLNHLKQLQLAWLSYTLDHEDRLPPDRIDHTNGWWQSLPGSWVVGNAQLDPTSANIKKGVLFPYNACPSIYRCPSDKSTVANLTLRPRLRSYSMNFFLNTEQAGIQFVPGCGWLQKSDIDRIEVLRNSPIEPSGKTRHSQLLAPPPAKIFVFLDVHEQSIDSGGFNLHPLTGSWGHLPADRHNQGCNLSFADGHVEHFRWRAPKVFHSERQFAEHPDDAADLKRLASGMPFPQ
ncbi:MAG: prepilin-type N-terminal cleavage/methylation domain-containing protein [Verrucomicrobia bacterium]|nr:prepilin-type N-terminal cleavage/methylation domain-containing protein [Verrucomicrobiota bacterium]